VSLDLPPLHPLISLALAHLADMISPLFEHQNDESIRYWISQPLDATPARDSRAPGPSRAIRSRHPLCLDVLNLWYEHRFPKPHLLADLLRVQTDPAAMPNSSHLSPPLQETIKPVDHLFRLTVDSRMSSRSPSPPGTAAATSPLIPEPQGLRRQHYSSEPSSPSFSYVRSRSHGHD
jgi:hypothetical protein